MYVDMTGLPRLERGMNHLIVWQRIYKDQQEYVLPVLYVLHGSGLNLELIRLDALVDYFLDHSSMSSEWFLLCIRTVGLLIDYFVACLPTIDRGVHLDRPRPSEAALIKGFATAFLNGTGAVRADRQIDSLGLYWRPRRLLNAREHLRALMRFLKTLPSGLWKSVDLPGPLMALKIAHRQVIQRRKSLLAHLKPDNGARSQGSSAGHGFVPGNDGQRTYRFPIKYIWDFLYKGFSTRSGEVDATAQLIAFILFAGGPRLSELFHVWVGDLQWVDDEPLLFLHHPRDGMVTSKGETLNRADFLKRQTRVPRNQMRKRGHSGFKGLAGDADGAELVWLPVHELKQELGRLLRNYITNVRPRIMRLRKAKGLPDHNYLFVGSGKVFGKLTNEIGDPYTISAFKSAWKSAIRRISNLRDDPELTVSKKKGTTPHAARHFYGSILKTIGCDGDLIARCMHHKSPFSHHRYTILTPNEIDNLLKAKSKGSVDLSSLKLGVTDALQRQAQGRRF